MKKFVLFFLVLIAVPVSAQTTSSELLAILQQLEQHGSIGVWDIGGEGHWLITENASMTQAMKQFVQQTPVYIDGLKINLDGRGLPITPDRIVEARTVGAPDLSRFAQSQLNVRRLSYDIGRQNAYIQRLETAIDNPAVSNQQLTNLTRELLEQQNRLNALNTQLSAETDLVTQFVARRQTEYDLIQRLRNAQATVQNAPPSGPSQAAVDELRQVVVAASDLEQSAIRLRSAQQAESLARQTLDTVEQLRPTFPNDDVFQAQMQSLTRQANELLEDAALVRNGAAPPERMQGWLRVTPNNINLAVERQAELARTAGVGPVRPIRTSVSPTAETPPATVVSPAEIPELTAADLERIAAEQQSALEVQARQAQTAEQAAGQILDEAALARQEEIRLQTEAQNTRRARARATQIEDARQRASGAEDDAVPERIRRGTITPADTEALRGGGGPIRPTPPPVTLPVAEQPLPAELVQQRAQLTQQLNDAIAGGRPQSEITQVRGRLDELALQENAWRANQAMRSRLALQQGFMHAHTPEEIAAGPELQVQAQQLRNQAAESVLQADTAQTELNRFRNARLQAEADAVFARTGAGGGGPTGVRPPTFQTPPPVTGGTTTSPRPTGGAPPTTTPPAGGGTGTSVGGGGAAPAGGSGTGTPTAGGQSVPGPQPVVEPPRGAAQVAPEATAGERMAAEAAVAESQATRTAGAWAKAKGAFKVAAKALSLVVIVNEIVQLGVDIVAAYSAPENYRIPVIVTDVPADAENTPRFELEIQPHAAFSEAFKTKYFVIPFEQQNLLYHQKFLQDFVSQWKALQVARNFSIVEQIDSLIRELSTTPLLQSVTIELFKKNAAGQWDLIKTTNCPITEKKVFCSTAEWGALSTGDYRLLVLAKLYGPIWNNVIAQGEISLSKVNCTNVTFAGAVSSDVRNKHQSEYCPFFRLATIPSDYDLVQLVTESQNEVLTEIKYEEVPIQVLEEFAKRTGKAFDDLPENGDWADALAAAKTAGLTAVDAIGTGFQAVLSPISVYRTRKNLVGQFDLFKSNLLAARQMAFGMPIIADFSVGVGDSAASPTAPIGSSIDSSLSKKILNAQLVDSTGNIFATEQIEPVQPFVVQLNQISAVQNLFLNWSGVSCEDLASQINSGMVQLNSNQAPAWYQRYWQATKQTVSGSFADSVTNFKKGDWAVGTGNAIGTTLGEATVGAISLGKGIKGSISKAFVAAKDKIVQVTTEQTNNSTTNPNSFVSFQINATQANRLALPSNVLTQGTIYIVPSAEIGTKNEWLVSSVDNAQLVSGGSPAQLSFWACQLDFDSSSQRLVVVREWNKTVRLGKVICSNLQSCLQEIDKQFVFVFNSAN